MKSSTPPRGNRWIEALFSLLIAGWCAVGIFDSNVSWLSALLLALISVAAFFTACWAALWEPSSMSESDQGLKSLDASADHPIVQKLDMLDAERHGPAYVEDSRTRRKVFRLLRPTLAMNQIVHDDPPTDAERVLAGSWLLFRRTLSWVVAAGLFIGAVFALTQAEWAAAFIGVCFGLACFWVGLKGGGYIRSFSDDAQVHERRKRRYGWRL